MDLLGLKEELIKTINKQICLCDDVANYEGKLLSDQFKQFDTDLNKYSSDLRRIMRDMKMKCVTIGNTSNGKSSVLNILLNTNILPTGRGRTTTRFISIEGCDDDKGFLMNDGQKQDMNEIGRFVSENREERQGIETIIKIFVPKSQCDLLNEYTEFWDCPGIDQSDEIDSLLQDNCQNADVFLIVINGGSTIEISEKSFFRGLIKEGIQPWIYFIVNKWDKIESARLDAIREQHKKSIKECFVDELKLYSNEKIEERIFFVSATNLSLEDEYGKCFERLKKRLKEDLGKENYHKKLKKMANQLIKIVNEWVGIFDILIASNKIKEIGSSELLQEKCREIVDKIFAIMDEEFDDAISWREFLFGKWLSLHTEGLTGKTEEIYRKWIIRLNEQLTKIFREHSCIEVSHDQLKQYLDCNVVFGKCNKMDCFLNMQNTDSICKGRILRHLHHVHSEVSDKIKICVDKFVEDQGKIAALPKRLAENEKLMRAILKDLEDLRARIEGATI